MTGTVDPSIDVLEVAERTVPGIVGLPEDDAGRFVLHFQPTVAIGTGAVIGVEALLRWQHDALGVAAPGGWLTRIEATGAIHRLGQWTLRAGIGTLAHLQQVAGPDFHMGINVSPLHLLDADVVGAVSAALDEHGVAPETVTIELTETSLFADVDAIREQIVAIRGLGCRIALDDFGVGYSSLQHLHRLPVDVLKLDRSYVNGLGVDKAGTVIVQGVLRIARGLHVTTIAEGVESTELRDALHDLGCAYAQGFLYDAALPVDALERLLATHPAYAPLRAGA